MEITIFAYNILHIIIIFLIIFVLYLHIKNIQVFLIFEDDYEKNNIKKNIIKKKEINSLNSTNQTVLSYSSKDLNQKVYIQNNAHIYINDSYLNLLFDQNKDYTTENYDSNEVYKLGDVVTVNDNGTLRDFVNLVTDEIGCINQNPLKDDKAWLEILIVQ